MHSRQSLMSQEIHATPEIVALQENALAQPLADLVARLRRQPPNCVVTCARGSSAHAATLGKHLIERYLGVPVAAAAPNIASVYRQELRLRNQLVLAISQSGKSDDLIAFAGAAKGSGALTVAITNDAEAPLAAECDIVLPLGAGPELSVAATKTFVATATVLMRLTAAWANDVTLLPAVHRLPERLAAAASLDWRVGVEVLSRANHLATIGRGPTLAIAREAALKLKEVCNLHTEAFSGAEFQHGPIALVSQGYPVLMFTADGRGRRRDGASLAVTSRLRAAALLIAGEGLPAEGHLPVVPADQAEADALCLIQSFYAMTLAVAERLGIDVDRPRNLHKITRTT